MRKIFLILAVLFFTGCTVNVPHKYTDITVNGKEYKCVDLNKGIYTDESNNKYRLGYEINGKKLNFYMVRYEK